MAWQASDEEGKEKDERIKRKKIRRGRIALILTFLSFYGLPRRLDKRLMTLMCCILFKRPR